MVFRAVLYLLNFAHDGAYVDPVSVVVFQGAVGGVAVACEDDVCVRFGPKPGFHKVGRRDDVVNSDAKEGLEDLFQGVGGGVCCAVSHGQHADGCLGDAVAHSGFPLGRHTASQHKIDKSPAPVVPAIRTLKQKQLMFEIDAVGHSFYLRQDKTTCTSGHLRMCQGIYFTDVCVFVWVYMDAHPNIPRCPPA